MRCFLVLQYESGTLAEQAERAAFYLTPAKRVDNWDLVDLLRPADSGGLIS